MHVWVRECHCHSCYVFLHQVLWFLEDSSVSGRYSGAGEGRDHESMIRVNFRHANSLTHPWNPNIWPGLSPRVAPNGPCHVGCPFSFCDGPANIVCSRNMTSGNSWKARDKAISHSYLRLRWIRPQKWTHMGIVTSKFWPWCWQGDMWQMAYNCSW